jgi:hypothetical protein
MSISDESTNLSFVPSSIKLQRPATARPNLNLPLSTKSTELSINLRTQAAINTKTSSWKRNATGMRLIPLSTQGFGGRNDMKQVTSLGFNTLKQQGNIW